MKINLLAVGALAAALVMPIGAYAQQNQPGAQAQNRSMPSEARMQHRWAKRLGSLNLSSDQQQRVQSLISQYAQTHPEGSPRDPSAGRELRRQLMGVLTPDQQNQFREQTRAHRAQMQQRNGQMQQGYQGQQQGPQQYQQGPPQQYQQGPPQQYQQGPPQQYQQGPPQQYQQGPPQDQQGPPPDEQQPSGPPPV
jgi:hypothetical protein